jgi:soluble lytic murein transglycosylase-like protein
VANYSTQQIQDMITQAATAAGLPPSVALAVAQQESSFNPNAIGPPNSNGTRDYGLFQLNTATLQQLGISTTQALDPATNINAGVQLLSQYYSQYGGDLPSVLGAYNAGPGAVSSGNLPTNYITSVMNIIGPQAAEATSAPSTDLTAATSTYTSGSVNILGTDIPITTLAIGGAAFLFAMWLAFKD